MENCCSCNKANCEIENEDKELIYLKRIINILGLVMFGVAIFVNKNGYAFNIYIYILSFLGVGYDVFFAAIKNIFKKDMFNENFLMSIAIVGTIVIGEYSEGIAVLVLYKIGEILQDLAVDKSKEKIKKILNIRPEYVNLVFEENIKVVSPEEVKISDIIIVKTGEKVPLDGIIIDGETELDTSTLTGESIPRNVKISDEVLSGSINIGKVITLKVTSLFEDSTVSKIIELIENATSKKSNTEKFITRFSKIYTPIVILGAILIIISFPLIFNMNFNESLLRALTFLVVSCPCALVISVPLGFFIGIGASSKNGILVKGSNYLDILTSVKTIVFDKTGTITKGIFTVKEIETTSELTKKQVLEYIANVESYSNHYIAKSILKYYEKDIDNSNIKFHEEIAGKGIKAIINESEVLVGNYNLMKDNNIVLIEKETEGSVIYLAIDNEYKGNLSICDEIKDDANNLVNKLKSIGIKKVVMLTGDNNVSKEIIENLNLDEIHKGLLPKDKVDILEKLKSELNKNEKIAFIGDGINDGPVIASSDIGISMGKGSDIAIKTSDIVLMTDEPSKLVEAIKISKNTKKIVMQNIIFAISIKVLFLIFSSLGILTMWFAVFADVGVTMIAILNCMRIFKSAK